MSREAAIDGAGPGATTATMRAQIELRERIFAGDYPAGTRLMEVSLAEALGISRTPVREAMARLAEEGLLERVRSGGFRVRSFGLEDALDAIELRGVLEGTAARLAAERGVPGDRLDVLTGILSDLDALFDATDEAFDFAAYSSLNEAFHRALWSLAGSDIVRDQIARVAALPFASPSAFTPDRANMAAFRKALVVAQDQHHAILGAIRGREGTRAEALLREHVRNARQNLDDLMRRETPHRGLTLVSDRAEAARD